MSMVAVRSMAMVLMLLFLNIFQIKCVAFMLVVEFCIAYIVFQSFHRRRESWLCYFYCIIVFVYQCSCHTTVASDDL